MIMEQATVHTVHPDGGVTLLRDDGVLVDAGPEAVAAGGWRALRPGQRVRVRRADHRRDSTIDAVLRPV
jgi:cold shock CspA family protein